MVRWRISAVWLTCAVASVACCAWVFGAPKTIAWKQDLAQGFAAAAKQHKLVMAEFFAPW